MAITLKAARVNVGMTQEEAAKRIGVTANTISRWELGISAPTCSARKNNTYQDKHCPS